MPALCRAPRCRSICRRSRGCRVKPLCHPEGSEAESRDLPLITALGEPLRSLHSLCSVGMTEGICGLLFFPHPARLRRATFSQREGFGDITMGIATPVCALVRNDLCEERHTQAVYYNRGVSIANQSLRAKSQISPTSLYTKEAYRCGGIGHWGTMVPRLP